MRRAAAAPLAALLALSGCGTEKPAKKDPFAAVPQRTVKASTTEASPRWEPIARLGGTRGETRAVEVSKGAIQWRTRWRCESGRLTVTVTPRPRSGPGSAGDACPGTGKATWVGTGPQRLGVQASGRWRLVVEEEVTTPLHEAPLAAMRSRRAHVLSRGRFHRIERAGRGTAALYRLPDGRLALRIESFLTDPNTGLFVWLSRAVRPRTTRQAFAARHTVLRGLKSTVGEQNYLLPRGLDARAIRSIVIWCDPVQIAYTAAALGR